VVGVDAGWGRGRPGWRVRVDEYLSLRGVLAMSANRDVPVDSVSPAEAMANGRIAGRLEALNEVMRFAIELSWALGPLDDPRPLRQVIAHCRDQIRAVQDGTRTEPIQDVC
jgi:hypothetical protein